MKVERPVIYTQIVCDFCKRDIDEDETRLIVKRVIPSGIGFTSPSTDRDMCEDCCANLTRPIQEKSPDKVATQQSSGGIWR